MIRIEKMVKLFAKYVADLRPNVVKQIAQEVGDSTPDTLARNLTGRYAVDGENYTVGDLLQYIDEDASDAEKQLVMRMAQQIGFDFPALKDLAKEIGAQLICCEWRVDLFWLTDHDGTFMSNDRDECVMWAARWDAAGTVKSAFLMHKVGDTDVYKVEKQLI